MSLKVLHVSNHSVERCGISNFGRQMSTALRRAGCQVTDWDGQYSTIYAAVQRGERAYLPADAETYDVIHFNWHPIVINHYGPGHFPVASEAWEYLPTGTGSTNRKVRRPILSVYLNDIPPWSGCPVHDRADVLFAAEPSPGCHVIPYPVCDWVADLPRPASVFTVGFSGIRGDGAAQVRGVCTKRDYAMNEPYLDRWLTYEEEIQRLARSTVNVCWYHEGRGISGGASQLTSARRPMILSRSSMFDHLVPYASEYYQDWTDTEHDLDEMLAWVKRDWEDHPDRMRRPRQVLEDLSWSRAALEFVRVWEEVRRV